MPPPSGPRPLGSSPHSAEPAEPDGPALLQLEARVRRQGSGLGPADLIGLWRFTRIWPKGQRQPSPLAGSLLRGFGACLRIEPGPGPEAAALQLTNAVHLGPVELRFQGPGRLEGRRPLLLFRFDTLQLRFADRVLLERTLPAPAPRRQAFFALIARGGGPETSAGPNAGSWLAARGRSGGLALWRRETAPGATLTPDRRAAAPAAPGESAMDAATRAPHRTDAENRG